MSVRERILTLRLIEKLSAHPTVAEALGIEYSQGSLSTEDAEKPP